jgi:hypothetical protein
MFGFGSEGKRYAQLSGTISRDRSLLGMAARSVGRLLESSECSSYIQFKVHVPFFLALKST